MWVNVFTAHGAHLTHKIFTAAEPKATRGHTPDPDSDSDSDSFIETDDLRRKLLADSGTGWKFDTVLESGPSTSSDDNDIIDLISDDENGGREDKISPMPKSTTSTKSGTQKPGASLANMVRNEVDHRKREQLGLVGERKLAGNTNQGTHRSRLLDLQTSKTNPVTGIGQRSSTSGALTTGTGEWACLVCTWCVNLPHSITQPTADCHLA
jgi:hypothetical protein